MYPDEIIGFQNKGMPLCSCSGVVSESCLTNAPAINCSMQAKVSTEHVNVCLQVTI